MNNQELIEKAAMTLSTLSSGGKLNTEQSAQFLKMIQDAPTILRDSRFVQMESDSRKIEKIGFGSRILRPGAEGTAVADNDRAVPTTSTVTLNAKEVIAEINITYDTLENNIEKDRLKDSIMQMLAERAALDIEELVLNGDTASADTYLALIDGLRKQSTSHVVNWNGVAFDRTVFKDMYKSVPKKYLRNPADWRYYTSHNIALEWADAIASRQSTLGDAALEGKSVTYNGVPVKGIAMLQEYDVDGAGASTDMVSDAFLTHPKNIIVGMSRNITLEVDKDIRERKFIIVLTAKLDTKFEEEDAVVKAIKIK